MRSRKYLDAARDQTCVLCASPDGVVAAHYSHRGAGALGNGMATKVSDLFVADLCHRCHTGFDQHRDGFGRADFLFAVLLTQRRRAEAGMISLP